MLSHGIMRAAQVIEECSCPIQPAEVPGGIPYKGIFKVGPEQWVKDEGGEESRGHSKGLWVRELSTFGTNEGGHQDWTLEEDQ